MAEDIYIHYVYYIRVSQCVLAMYPLKAQPVFMWPQNEYADCKYIQKQQQNIKNNFVVSDVMSFKYHHFENPCIIGTYIFDSPKWIYVHIF